MKDTSTDQIMTDKFLEIFISGCPVETTPHLPTGRSWFWKGGISETAVYYLGYEDYNKYQTWKETLPPLLLELV